MADSVMRAALEAAERGWTVFPLHGIRNGVCTCRKRSKCGSAGKHPRTSKGHNDATSDPVRIERWGDEWDGANIGIATGAESGLVVVDVDPRNGGEVTLDALEDDHGKLSETVLVLTGGGGSHHYFAHPGDIIIPSGNNLLGAGLDVKADCAGGGSGGYVVAPPSLHESGQRYGWEASSHPEDCALAPLPSWIIGFLQMRTDETEAIRGEDCLSLVCNPSVSSVNPGAHYDLILRAVPKTEGERNQRLFWLARRMKGIYPHHPAQALREIIRDWHRRSLPTITTKDFTTSWAEFTYAWQGRIRKPADPNLLPDVLAAAVANYPLEAAQYDLPKVRLLVSICAELQRRSPRGDFFLASRDAGEMIGTSHTAANMYLQMLAADGLLVQTRPSTTFRAPRYRYTGGRK